MDNKEFSKLLEERTLQFGVSIIKLSSRLPGTVEGKIVRNQITKSGTSVGANYREANRSRSTRDFKNKIIICEGESSETCYWLDIIERMNWLESQELKPDQLEASELLAIFTSIGNKL
jgi:four helix bundle protein